MVITTIAEMLKVSSATVYRYAEPVAEDVPKMARDVAPSRHTPHRQELGYDLTCKDIANHE